MPVSIKKIADKLGLSSGTVSMALNGQKGVSENTRSLVLKTAEGMGYTKHLQNKGAASGNIQLIIYKKHGDVVADTPFFSELIQGIEQGARQNGGRLLISYFYEGQDIEAQLGAITAAGSLGNVLLATEMQEEDLEIFSRLSAPMVILDSFYPGTKYDCIGIGNTHGACEAVRYLASMNHREIGYLSSSVKIRNFREREDGFIKGIRALGIWPDIPFIQVELSPVAAGAVRDMERFLEQKPKLPTAFFADNDIIATSAISALKKAGYRVPEDISVIGFDDMPMNEIMDPPLSTMSVPKFRMGVIAVNRLFEIIREETEETLRIELTTSLVERGSVKKYKAE